MRSLERVPAVRRIETDRRDLFAIEITGTFTSADAENLFGLLEGAYALSNRLDLLVRIVELEGVEIDDFDAGTKSGLRRHLDEHVRRCAVIDGSDGTDAVVHLLKPGGNVETRRFDLSDEDAAWQWLETTETVA